MSRIPVVRLVLVIACTGCVGEVGTNDSDQAGGSGATSGASSSPGGGTGGGSAGAGANKGGSPGGGGSAMASGGNTGKGGTQGSPDAGAAGTGGSAVKQDAAPPLNPDDPPPGYRPSIVAVGWGGVRVLSTDAGKTWGNRFQLASGPDEPTLLRAIAHGAGTWVAVGVPLFTSPDGLTWTARPNPTKTQYGTQWFGDVAYGNGMFVAAGGCGVTMRSRDRGVTWITGPELSVGNCTDHMRSVAFGGGQFAAAGDKKIVHVTTDGVKWSVLAGLSTSGVAYCGGAFKNQSDCAPVGMPPGVFVRSAGGWPKGGIDRSSNGKDWQRVHDDSNPITTFGFGFSPP